MDCLQNNCSIFQYDETTQICKIGNGTETVLQANSLLGTVANVWVNTAVSRSKAIQTLFLKMQPSVKEKVGLGLGILESGGL